MGRIECGLLGVRLRVEPAMVVSFECVILLLRCGYAAVTRRRRLVMNGQVYKKKPRAMQGLGLMLEALNRIVFNWRIGRAWRSLCWLG
jgi:hypothetical protein